MTQPNYIIEIYQGRTSRTGKQSWRWRAVNAGNHRKQATGGEAYHNKQDCINSATMLFSSQTTVHLVEPDGQQVVRVGVPTATCMRCGHDVVFHVGPEHAGCTQCQCLNYWALQEGQAT